LLADDVGNRRDFEGFWHGKMEDSSPTGLPSVIPGVGAPIGGAELLPYNAAGQQVVARRREWAQQGKLTADTHLTCRPNGAATLTPLVAIALITQTPDKLVLISQEGRDVRLVFMNQAHPKKLMPSYMGHSVGRWDGDTLVVDTVGYNGRSTISGVPGIDPPTSEQLHTVERWTKGADGNTLTIVLRIEDPVYYTKPFTQTYTWQRFSQRVRLLDYDCSENPREDDFAAWVFEDDWFKPVCIRPVRDGIASEKVICTSRSKLAEKK
jgi:hypothetical protein